MIVPPCLYLLTIIRAKEGNGQKTAYSKKLSEKENQAFHLKYDGFSFLSSNGFDLPLFFQKQAG
jgi:hypothetical protein